MALDVPGIAEVATAFGRWRRRPAVGWQGFFGGGDGVPPSGGKAFCANRLSSDAEIAVLYLFGDDYISDGEDAVATPLYKKTRADDCHRRASFARLA